MALDKTVSQLRCESTDVVVIRYYSDDLHAHIRINSDSLTALMSPSLTHSHDQAAERQRKCALASRGARACLRAVRVSIVILEGRNLS